MRRIIIRAIVQHAGGFDVRPDGFLRLVAVRPVGRQPMIGVRINQFQTAAAAVRPLAPASARAIGHFVFRHIESPCWCSSVCGMDKRHQFAVMRKFAAEIAHRVAAVQIGIIGKQIGHVARHHQIAVRRDDDVGGKVNVTPAVNCQPPRFTVLVPWL